MRLSIKSIFALALTGLILTSSTLAVKAADPKQITTLTSIKKFNKINVSGNVELILVQRADQDVKVYDNYYANNALVQEKDGELRISSFNKEPLTVVVSVNNLSAITASNTSTVKTFGKFNVLSLDVTLKDQASAILNTNTINLYADLNGQSNLSLSGSTTEYNAIMGSLSKVNTSSFVANQSKIQSKSTNLANVKKTNTALTLEDFSTLEKS